MINTRKTNNEIFYVLFSTIFKIEYFLFKAILIQTSCISGAQQPYYWWLEYWVAQV